MKVSFLKVWIWAKRHGFNKKHETARIVAAAERGDVEAFEQPDLFAAEQEQKAATWSSRTTSSRSVYGCAGRPGTRTHQTKRKAARY